MINKFAATCVGCKETVLAGHGETNKKYGKWQTNHIECRHLIENRYNTNRTAIHELSQDNNSNDNEWEEDFNGISRDHNGWTNNDWKEALNPDEGDAH